MQKKLIPILFGVLFPATLLAESHLQQQLESIGATNITITDSVLPGFKTAMSDQGVVHITQDGRFVIQGQIFELKQGKVIDITHRMLMPELEALKEEMIIYPAKNQQHIVTVFMDITCHYCHLLHSKMKEYNDLGITIRYLAFPRGGMNTKTAQQMESIWTAKDKVFALNEAENGKLPKELKSPNIVKKHYELGIKFGVNGTPNIVTQEGTVIPGFVEPQELLEMLNQ